MTGVSEEGPVSLDQLKQIMSEFAKERDWEQFHSPRNLLLALVCFSLFTTQKQKKCAFLVVLVISPCMNILCLSFFNPPMSIFVIFERSPSQSFHLFSMLFCWGDHVFVIFDFFYLFFIMGV